MASKQRMKSWKIYTRRSELCAKVREVSGNAG